MPGDSFHSLILAIFLIVKATALVNAIIDLSSRFHPDVRMDLLIFLLQLDDVTVIVTLPLNHWHERFALRPRLAADPLIRAHHPMIILRSFDSIVTLTGFVK